MAAPPKQPTMKKVELTREIHNDLKKSGYKYLLITDAAVICPVNRLYSLTLKPDTAIPACQVFSCTDIDDVLITGFLSQAQSNCSLFVELPGS